MSAPEREPRRADGAAPLLLAGAAFLVSGAAGLVYQVAWQRILALHERRRHLLDRDDRGRFHGRPRRRQPPGRTLEPASSRRGGRCCTFALVELGIGAFGARELLALLRRPLRRAALALRLALDARRLMHFVALALPTLLMGTSLPFLVRAMVGEARTAGRTIGVLYGINLLGAAGGAAAHALAADPLLRRARRDLLGRGRQRGRRPGRARALRVRSAGDGPSADEDAPADAARARRRRPADAVVRAVDGASTRLAGFCALSLEILWFRLLEVAVKSNAFTFGTMLALYLLGSAVGLPGRRAVRVAAAPAPARVPALPVRAAGVRGRCRGAAGRTGPSTASPLDWYRRTGRSPAGSTWARAMRTPWRRRAPLPAGFPWPSTARRRSSWASSFPVLQRAVQDDPRTSGRKVGLLQAANIAGLRGGQPGRGPAGAGLAGHHRHAAPADGRGRRSSPPSGCAASARARVFAPLLAGAAGAGGRSCRDSVRSGSASTAPPRPNALVEEDATGVAAILPTGSPPWRVFVERQEPQLAPVRRHPQLAGRGARRRASRAGGRRDHRPGLRRTPPGRRAAARRRARSRCSRSRARSRACCAGWRAARSCPTCGASWPIRACASRVADGRNALARGERCYDLIEADALWPDVSYAGNLYSARVLRAVRTPPQAGRRRLHLGAHAAGLRGLHPRRPPRRGTR